MVIWTLLKLVFRHLSNNQQKTRASKQKNKKNPEDNQQLAPCESQ